MIGRAAYHNPYLFAQADQLIYGDQRSVISRKEVLEGMLPYMSRWAAKDMPLGRIARHMMGLLKGQPGGRDWRRHVTQTFHSRDPKEIIHGFLDHWMSRFPEQVG